MIATLLAMLDSMLHNAINLSRGYQRTRSRTIKSIFRMKQTLVLLLLLLLGTMFSGCKETPLEELISQHIDAITEGIETGKPDLVLEHFDEGFSTPSGQDRHWVKRIMLAQMLRKQTIHVVLTNLTIESRDDFTTDASFNVLLTGSQGLIPREGAFYQVETQWRLQDGDWLVNYASWRKP